VLPLSGNVVGMELAVDIQQIDQRLGELERLAASDSPLGPLCDELLRLVQWTCDASAAAIALPLSGSDPDRRARQSSKRDIGEASFGENWLILASHGSWDDPDRLLELPLGRWMSRQLLSRAETDPSRWLAARSGREGRLAVPLGRLGFEHGALIIRQLSPATTTVTTNAPSFGMLELLEAFANVAAEAISHRQRLGEAAREQQLTYLLPELYRCRDKASLRQVLAQDLPGVLGGSQVLVFEPGRGEQRRLVAITGSESLPVRSERIGQWERLVAGFPTCEPKALRLALPVAGGGDKPLADSARQSAGGTGKERTSSIAPNESTDAPSATPPDAWWIPLNAGRAAVGGDAPRREPPTGCCLLVRWESPSEMTANLAMLRRLYPHLIAAGELSGLADASGWMRLGREGRTWVRLLAIAFATVGVVAAIVASRQVEIDFWIEAEGFVEPVEQQWVFATRDGLVERLEVDQDDWVKPGQLLAQLRSPELDRQLQEVEGELAALNRRLQGVVLALHQATRGGNGANVTTESAVLGSQLAAEQSELEQRLENLVEQQRLLVAERSSLTLVSRLAGQVVTWDPQRYLPARPVRRGDALLRVVDSRGAWHLRLMVPHTEVAHIERAWSAAVAGAAKRPRVRYRLLSDPEQVLEGELTAVAGALQANLSGTPKLPLEVAILDEPLTSVPVEASAQAQIHCGRRTLWYVWTRKLVEATRRRFWWGVGDANER
jgi:multidrug efflux pump subunit AcrA (membrane-fusion protein)